MKVFGFVFLYVEFDGNHGRIGGEEGHGREEGYNRIGEEEGHGKSGKFGEPLELGI